MPRRVYLSYTSELGKPTESLDDVDLHPTILMGIEHYIRHLVLHLA